MNLVQERGFNPRREGGDFCVHGNKMGNCARCAQQQGEQDPTQLDTSRSFEDEAREQGLRLERERVDWDENIEEIVWIESTKEQKDSKIPTMRAYRGVGRLDSSLLQQVGYALRSRETRQSTEVRVLDAEVREAAEALSENPTHEQFLAYYEAVSAHLNDQEMERMEQKLRRMEDRVLGGGFTFRTILSSETTHFNGGYTDTGAPPFLSATTQLDVARGYSGDVLMVLDVPVSEIEPMYGAVRDPDIGGELILHNRINPEHIKALIVYSEQGRRGRSEEQLESVEGMVSHIEERIGAENNVEGVDWLTKKREELDEGKEEQHKKDVESIYGRRLERFNRVFRVPNEVRLAGATIAKTEKTDSYTGTMRAMFDSLTQQFEMMSGSDNWKYWQYQDERRNSLPVERDTVTEKMLKSMQDRIERDAQYYE